jgi:ABC-type transporter Mla subunit MlaD
MNNENIQLACIALIALCVLVQTIFLLAMSFGVKKGLSALKEEVDDMKSSVMPTVEKARLLIDDANGFVSEANAFVSRVSPKVESTAADFAAFASTLRTQAAEVKVAVGEILVKVDKQGTRIDNMFSGTLDAVDKASSFVTQTVGKPVRQLSGLVAGVKAAVESLRTNGHPVREHGHPDDKDMFV